MARAELRALRGRADETLQLVVIVLIGIAVASSFLSPLGTPFLLGLLGLTLLFLPQLTDVMMIAFPLALANPQLRVGSEGFVVEAERSFHPLNVNMTELFVAAILAGWLLRGRQRRGESQGGYLNVPIIGLVVVTGLATYLAKDLSEGIRIAFERILEPLVVFFVVTHTRWEKPRLRRAMGVMIAVVLFVAIRSVWQYFLGPAPVKADVDVDLATRTVKKVHRLQSEWADTNIQAGLFTLTAPLAFLWSLYHPSPRGRFASLISFGAFMMGTALTYTRAAWLAMVVVLGFLSRNRRRALAFLIIVALVVAATSTADMIRRGKTLFHAMNDQSATNRLVVWEDTLSMIVHSAFVGIGLGTFMKTYAHMDKNVHPHNDYLFMTVEGGILSLLFFLMIVFKVLGRLRAAMRKTGDALDRLTLAGLGGAVVGYLVQGNFDCLLAWGQYNFAFWFMLGIAAAYAQAVLAENPEEAAEGGDAFAAAPWRRNARSDVEGTLPLPR